MNKDFWNKVTELEELAKKATQGKWIGYYEDNKHINGAINNEDIHITLVNKSNCKNNTAFIAAANPTMILEMVATFKGRLSFLEHELVEKDIELENTKAELRMLDKEADWLAGELRSWESDVAYPGGKISTIKEIREAARIAVGDSNG